MKKLSTSLDISNQFQNLNANTPDQEKANYMNVVENNLQTLRKKQ